MIVIDHCNYILLLIVWIIITLFSTFMYVKHLASAMDRRQNSVPLFPRRLLRKIMRNSLRLRFIRNCKKCEACFCKHTGVIYVYRISSVTSFTHKFAQQIIAKLGTLFLSRCEIFKFLLLSTDSSQSRRFECHSLLWKEHKLNGQVQN